MKIPVTILGATGLIGQHYVSLLHNHPWFEIKCLVGSTPSDCYQSEMQRRWHQSQPIPEGYQLHSIDNFEPTELIFSALPNELAGSLEPSLAKNGSLIISSASCHRTYAPLIIPEINPHHLDKSRIISKPNCAIQSFLLPLAPLHNRAQIRSLSVTTLQALSGAGTSALDRENRKENIIPFISGEEDKLETEPLKILDAQFPISAHCNRVPVLHGHFACVSVSFEKKLSHEEILRIWEEPSCLDLPSAPRFPVIYQNDPSRPQTCLDCDVEKGMSVTVGRLRPCPLLDWRFVALSHNAIRGGAGGGVLIAELLKKEGYFGKA